MKKLFTLILSLAFSSASFAVVVNPTEISPSSEELTELGIEIHLEYSQLMCGDSTEIVISIPNVHRGASFHGASVGLKDEDEYLFFVNARHSEAQEMPDSPTDSSELFLCLHPSLYESAVITLSYGRGQHLTDVIIFGID